MLYALRRVAYAAVVMLLVSVVTFLALRVAPGDVTTFLYNPVTTPPEVLQAAAHRLGLDQPLVVQYWHYLSDLLTGDFGVSYTSREPVTTIVANAFGYTLILAAAAFLVAYGLGIPAGVLAALHKDTWVDRVINSVAGVTLAIPEFVLALLLVILFGVTLDWLPVSGAGSWECLIMPAIALGAAPGGLCARVTRTAILEQRSSDFVRTLHARGLSERRINWRHVLRNSMSSVISLGSVEVRNLLGYAMIIEVIFRWPGIGNRLVISILQRDYAVAQILAVLLALVVVIASFTGDLLLAWNDPRIRKAGPEIQ
jgi:peptide/nickel transport system permease protein